MTKCHEMVILAIIIIIYVEADHPTHNFFFNISFISSKSGCSGQGCTFHNCFSYPHYSSSILSNNSTGLEYVTTNQGYRAKFLIHDNSPQIPFIFHKSMTIVIDGSHL